MFLHQLQPLSTNQHQFTNQLLLMFLHQLQPLSTNQLQLLLQFTNQLQLMFQHQLQPLFTSQLQLMFQHQLLLQFTNQLLLIPQLHQLLLLLHQSTPLLLLLSTLPLLRSQRAATVTDGLSTSVDLTLLLPRIAETESSPSALSDALLKTSLIALHGPSQDAPTSQPSLEPGAEPSLLDNALQEEKDSSQTTPQSDLIAMDSPSTNVDLTPSPTLTADRSSPRSALRTSAHPRLIALTAMLSPSQDALIS
jgi:hypothetical protein